MRQRSGFSLLELSIVLAIIGLLAGTVVAGQAVLNGAKLKSVTANAQAYLAASAQFRSQYNALPGDMRNATSYWGAATCPNGSGTGTATCNGNGNRVIEQWDEMYRAWQHLVNSGLVVGTYTGTYAVSVGGVGVPGTNIPADKIPQSGWSLLALMPSASEFGYADAPARALNMLLFGKSNTTTYASDVILKVDDAFEIDQKMDDGKPGLGRVLGGPAGSCSSTTAMRTSAYSLSGSNLCRLGFQVN